MKVPIAIAEKIKAYQNSKETADRLFQEVVEWFDENGADGVCITDLFISNNPSGAKQNDEEYCDQRSVGDSGDSFEGSYYHQIDGTDQYAGYKYWC